MIKRRKTRQIKVADLRIGGGAPVSIQSMTKVDTSNVNVTISQIKELEDVGCEIVRVAVKTSEDADAIRKKEEVAQVAKAAKKAKIPIRIGANSGSVLRGTGEDMVEALVNLAMKHTKLFEDMGFHDIIISLKASDVVSTVEAYRRIAGICDYPLHLGVTAAGLHDSGIVKSAIGIGALLLDGIGDTIRVSLTSPDPVDEVIAGKRILGALGIRKFGPEIIACPTCGRCQVDLVKIVKELEKKLYPIPYTLYPKRPVTIAVMGCEVNGPGEAMDADIGIAFGKDSGMLFKKGKILKKVSASTAVKELLKCL
ncbi:MAG: flavodoxin-dependent (E)-4-hydroxy-3-methylbut-2-enyl-diphosphate synthase [Candidatus Omnitrophica bacterium]|nr:flavodoxin-dependent (E)-4-hydroxy-3-methylbut-2-enyl-diphosphate synthase [Candidatus Omnitrophota bacterium]